QACGLAIIQQSSEACDDGNSDNTDGCTNACELPACGDGFIQDGEQCDDGNTADNDGCSGSCNVESCGDAILQSGEECDDGNSLDGDGCSSDCLVEPEVDCDGIVDACGVCDGDGTSCLGCENVDQFSTLASLDGGANSQREVVIRSISLLTRLVKSQKARNYGRRIRNKADALYVQNWTLIFEIPTTVTSCANTILCVATDVGTQEVEGYNANAFALHDLTKQVIRKARRASGRSRIGQKLIRLSEARLQENLNISASVSTFSSTCD
ncbi:MAG: DUF4215 domain-containing protein, partial [Bdellovibrionales bacterium]|nr:DUF4215 domain-containing protein [Bdellovibrionales bacterium]